MTDLSLDVSGLEPPEPLERILDTLTDLPPGDRLLVVHRREPFPLYDLLRQLGYEWRTERKDNRFEILIWTSGGVLARPRAGAGA